MVSPSPISCPWLSQCCYLRLLTQIANPFGAKLHTSPLNKTWSSELPTHFRLHKLQGPLSGPEGRECEANRWTHTCGVGWSGRMLRALGIQKDSSFQPTQPQCSHVSLWTQSWHPVIVSPFAKPKQNQVSSLKSLKGRKCKIIVEKTKMPGNFYLLWIIRASRVMKNSTSPIN